MLERQSSSARGRKHSHITRCSLSAQGWGPMWYHGTVGTPLTCGKQPLDPPPVPYRRPAAAGPARRTHPPRSSTAAAATAQRATRPTETAGRQAGGTGRWEQLQASMGLNTRPPAAPLPLLPSQCIQCHTPHNPHTSSPRLPSATNPPAAAARGRPAASRGGAPRRTDGAGSIGGTTPRPATQGGGQHLVRQGGTWGNRCLQASAARPHTAPPRSSLPAHLPSQRPPPPTLAPPKGSRRAKCRPALTSISG